MNSRLLIVEGGDSMKSLQGLLQRIYKVKTASDGSEAIEVLNQGFDPAVIISDYTLPDRSGKDFFLECKLLNPEAVRLMTVDFSNKKEIIANIKQADLFMFLKKPVNELEIVYSIRAAFDHFNAQSKTDELKQRIERCITHQQKFGIMLQNAAHALNTLSVSIDRFFFKSHSQVVTAISKAVGDELGMDSTEVSKLAMSSILFNSSLSRVPREMIVGSLTELTANQRANFFKYFDWSVDVLSRYSMLKEYSRIVAAIFEHKDGSGHPKGLAEKEIPKEAQIVALAHIYHCGVYRISDEQMQKRMSGERISQHKDETIARHHKIMKFIKDSWAWFDYDVYRCFYEVIVQEKVPEIALGVKTENLEPKEMGKGNTMPAGEKVTFQLKESKIVMVEEEIPIDKIKSGMILGQDIYTSNGMKVYRSDTPLDEKMIKKIKSLEATGAVQRYITIMVPRAE